MPHCPTPIGGRNLTGQRRIRIGWFGRMIAEVQVNEGNGSVVWARCRRQWEWDWCEQFEQQVKK